MATLAAGASASLTLTPGDQVTLEGIGNPVATLTLPNGKVVSVTLQGRPKTLGPFDMTGTATLACAGGDLVYSFVDYESQPAPGQPAGSATPAAILAGLQSMDAGQRVAAAAAIGAGTDQAARDAAAAAAAAAAQKYAKPGGGIPESDLAAAVQTKLNESSGAASNFGIVGKYRSFAESAAGVPAFKRWKFGAAADGSDGRTPVTSAAGLSAAGWQPYSGLALGGGAYLGSGKAIINGEFQIYQEFSSAENFVILSDALRLQPTSADVPGWGVYAYGNWSSANAVTINEVGGATTTPAANLELSAGELAALVPGHLMWAIRFGASFAAVVKAVDTGGSTVTLERVSGSAVAAQTGFGVQQIFSKMPFARLTTTITETSTSATFESLPATVVAGQVLRPVKDYAWMSGGTRYPKVASVSGNTVTFDGPAAWNFGTIAAVNGNGCAFFPETKSAQIWTSDPMGPNKDGVRVCAWEVAARFPDMGAQVPVQEFYSKAAFSRVRSMWPGRKGGFWPAKWPYAVPFDGSTAGFTGDENDGDEFWPYLSRGGRVWTGNKHVIDWTADDLTVANAKYKTLLLNSIPEGPITNGTYTNVALTGGSGTGAQLSSITVGNGVITAFVVNVFSLGAAYQVGDTLQASFGGQLAFFKVAKRHDVISGAAWVPVNTQSHTLTQHVDLLMLPRNMFDGQVHHIGQIWTREAVYEFVDRKLARISYWQPTGPDAHSLGLNVAIGPGVVEQFWQDYLPNSPADVSGCYMDILHVDIFESA